MKRRMHRFIVTRGSWMKRALLGCACAAWLAHAACGGTLPTPKKVDPSQPISIPWDDLDERVTSIAKKMMEKPTLMTRGPAETFPCMPEQYFWLLDHPDRAVTAWRRLGAKCVTIQRRGPGKFGYVDDAGSDVTWETIHQSPGLRIWYADGGVKAGPLLPIVPVRALILLRHTESKLLGGGSAIHHQSGVVIHTGSGAANAVTKLMGQSAPKLARDGLGRLQLFFSALSCYLDRHPERVEPLFRPGSTKSFLMNLEKRWGRIDAP